MNSIGLSVLSAFFVVSLLVVSQPALSQQKANAQGRQEAVITLRSAITGNQEQPKVPYIVPWQQAGIPESVYTPMTTMISTVFSPIERNEFLREINYKEKISISNNK